MADNDIIDFYKKADNDSKPEEPLKEQKETPEPVVSESVAVPVPESNDPFDKFLFNLAEKLKTEKKITEQQQQQFNKRVVQPTTNPEDPFAKFLESFAGLVKEDENINKEENIKEATIDFINKLKNDDFFDRDIPNVIPKVKQAKSKSKKYLPPKFAKKVEKVEEEQPVIEQSTEPETEVKQPEPSNPYLKELQSTDKKKNKIEDKISGLSDIKKIIAQQVQEQLSKYPNIGFTGGGGGTNAVQYAKGGTMDGDLNVTGKFLSGGVDISTLFSTGGGGVVSGIPDRLIAGSETLRLYSNGTIDFPNDTIRPPDETILTLESENPTLSSYTRVALSPYAFFAYDNEGNSITFDEVDNAIVLTSKDLYEWTFNQQGVLAGPNGHLTVNALSSLGRILSGGKDLTEIFLMSASDAQTLSWIPSSYLLSISNGNSVSLASLSSAGGGTGRDDVNTLVIQNSANWNTAYSNVSTQSLNTTNNVQFNQVNANVYLSGGINLYNLLSSSGGGGTGRDDVNTVVIENSASWIDTTTVVQNGSANWDTAYNTATVFQTNSGNYILDGGNAKGSSIYIGTVDNNNVYFETNSSARAVIDTAGNVGIGVFSPTTRLEVDGTITTTTDGNSVQWNTAYNTATALQSISGNYLSLSGGTVTGDVTITGNLTALGTTLFQNTVFTTASTLSVINTGPGPALYVYQSTGPYDVASFYDGDGIEVLHVGNANPNGLGRVGINESFPNLELTVRGSVSATGAILASAIDISTSILSAGVNLSDIFTGKEYINSNFFPLSGGTVTGKTIIAHDGDVVDPNSPYTLSIQRNVGSTWLEILNSGGPDQGAFFGMTGNNFEQWNYQGGDILFYTAETPSDGNERLIIKNNGNVGIGGSNPASRLQVNGTITTDAISFTTPAEIYSNDGSIRFLHIDDTTNSNNDIYFKIEHENSDNQPTGYITIGTRGAVNKARYSGQVSGMTTDVVIRANTGGWDGNSIILTFDGVATIDTVIAIWNAANPSNQVTLISGDGTQIPDNGAVIGLAGGGDAAYIQGQNSEFRIEQAGNSLADIKSRNVILVDSSTYRGTFNAQGKLNDNRTYDLPNADGTLALESYVSNNFLNLTGGVITNDLTVQGNISALGTATFANTIFTTTSALSVINTGPGPALYVFQASGPYDVASFYDGDGIEVLHVGNAGPGGFGKVGVNESFPNQELTVKGSISATDTIYANSYLSAGVNLLDIFTGGGGGGGVTTTKKFDYVTVSNIDYSYSGTAVQGTLETSPTWKLIRLTYANNGTISNQASALNSWTGRLTATYV